MKKWNEPKVWSLGIGSTNEDMLSVEEIATYGGKHWCHVAGEDGTGGWVNNNDCNHPKNNGHKKDDQLGHDWNEAHKNKCCCS